MGADAGGVLAIEQEPRFREREPGFRERNEGAEEYALKGRLGVGVLVSPCALECFECGCADHRRIDAVGYGERIEADRVRACIRIDEVDGAIDPSFPLAQPREERAIQALGMI